MSVSPEILKTEVLVVGAGVLGLCTAVELNRRGHEVRVIETGGVNASSVAAGMIAPAMEAVLDAVSPERAALFREARAAWDGFAAVAGITINTGPTVWAGDGARDMAEALRALGFEVGEPGSDGRLAMVSDGLVEPGPAMAAMAAALAHPVITGRVVAVERRPCGWRVVTNAGWIEAQTLVLATGAAGAVAGLPEVVAALIAGISPIRGQIGYAAGAPVEAIVRGRGVYVAPSGGGRVIGATMEPGRRDLEPDVKAGTALLAAAETLLGQAVTGLIEWRVGVRGATADGLPMAGPSGEAGLYLALAPRRNGWLLGPLVGQIVADAVERAAVEAGGSEDGGAGSSHAAALDPRRFIRRT